jgi:hypothetical protein
MIDPNLISMIGGGRQAAAARAKKQEEEEEMTPYSAEDSLANWEFKIIRSGTGSFGHPEKLRKALEEEARAGWELLEKFDDNRVRLRRPITARNDDFSLDFDPYRTWIGVSESGMVARGLIFSAILGALIFAIVLLTAIL